MAVIQKNKDNKIRLVLDWREANDFIETYTRDADVCVSKSLENGEEWVKNQQLLIYARLIFN